MPTYLVKTKYKITRQEGDTADIGFIVPDVIDMTGRKVLFQVRDESDNLRIEKTDTAGITVTGQGIIVDLSPADSTGNDGIHNWELQVMNPESTITIGKGQFVILKQVAK